jgi:tripartite-type tricarboxylate transporter receptor subunit TctC
VSSSRSRPGGGTDIIARETTQKVAAATGWTFVIDNKPGAGGNLGVDAVAKAPADGYTIVLGQTQQHRDQSVALHQAAVRPAEGPGADRVDRECPVGDGDRNQLAVEDAVGCGQRGQGQAGSGELRLAGNGTVAHLTEELFQKAAGIKTQHVPYKGANQALTDVISGNVELYMSSVPTLLGHIKQGKLRALAVTSAKRVDDLPNVPTINESGYKGFDAVTWFGLLAPAATPKDVIAKLNAEFNKALKLPELSKRLGDEGADTAAARPRSSPH